jgi:signal transduction histidine kinase
MRKDHDIAFTFEDDRKPKPVDEKISVLLFSFVRELLVNVIKHAKATNVTVALKRCSEEMLITVEDDGVGFDSSQVGANQKDSSGFGLFSIRERLRHMGGSFEIESTPKRGTRVSLRVPLKREI